MLSSLCYLIVMLSGEILASLSPSLRGVLCICTCWMSMYYSGPFQVSAVTSECTPCCLYYGHALCVYSWFCLMVVVRLFYLPHGGCKVICSWRFSSVCTCWMSMYYSGPFQVSAVTSGCTPWCLYYGHTLCVYSFALSSCGYFVVNFLEVFCNDF